MKLSDYDYTLPKELIAHAPAEPRDSARLFVYSTKTNEIVIDTFVNLARYIPVNSVLVLNDTQVVPARIELSKITGGTVRILFLFNEWDKKGPIKGLPDRKLSVGDILFINHSPCLEIVAQNDQEFTFKLVVSPVEFEKIRDTYGHTPLPPYIDSKLDESEAREKYQTIFATQPASVAAPTASLHFTERVVQSLITKNVERVSVTLHVGRGTFSPMDDAIIKSGELHSEPIVISDKTSRAISIAKKEGRTIISSGTTATRAIESAADLILAGKGYDGETPLMISPPYDFKIVDAMITNFHLPRTSLLMLLDAFLQYKGAKKSWRTLYEQAIKDKFRFYSFGDAMLII